MSMAAPDKAPAVAAAATAASPQGKSEIEGGKTTGWNTQSLGLRLAADGAAAATAGALVAPLITMIDKAIMENASGRCALVPSLRASLTTLAFRPHHFLLSRPFALVFALYTGTYLTANTLDTFSSTTNPSKLSISSTTAGPQKFIATSLGNLTLCLYKDSQFTRLFGAAGAANPTRPVGPSSYALFAARDCLTIFASFNVPPLLAPYIPVLASETSRLSAAQFIAPAALQIFSTPLHLLGLDLYNRPGGQGGGWKGRVEKIRMDWFKSALARMGRIVPAFGVGGVVNMTVRKNLMDKIE